MALSVTFSLLPAVIAPAPVMLPSAPSNTTPFSVVIFPALTSRLSMLTTSRELTPVMFAVRLDTLA